MIRQTSVEAYADVRKRITERHKQVAEALAIYGNLSNFEISIITNLPINCVTPRVLELRQMGFVKERGTKINSIGRRVLVWGL